MTHSISIRLALATLATTAFATGQAFAETRPGALNDTPQLVTVAPTSVFMPTGFDDNDNAQIVVAGEYTSTCFKSAPPTARVDRANKKVVIENHAYYYPNCWCLFVLVPYSHVVDLGPLAQGNYQVEVANETGGTGRAGNLGVAVAHGAMPDDYLYAPVRELNVTYDSGHVARRATLKGTFNNDCMSIDDVKVIHNAQNVVEVLPVVKLREGECRAAEVPFEATFELPRSTGEPKKALIHVRSLNGQSLNQVVDL